ncbi:zinc ABC transporter ATP-binding protein AztA [Desertivibrio insolitus]|uniref:zinc ABC transporter ATP-binding protein AztA n=1 Tax=Herbiconiux sp. SYSU D00978 TaxID=2812562 RepID=UPI001A97673F|nr:zinc ABC transporter ATP-binding protein AztA [Herbiconiux sp. SYSU D00978]
MLPLAELTGVRVEYDGRAALQGLDFVVSPGEAVAVVGANGSGKSTLLSVLAGVRMPDAGRARFHPALRRAFVPQRSAVPDSLPLSAADVVSMGRWSAARGRPLVREDRAIVAEALDAMSLGALASAPLSTMSGGQRQRTFVAQGLAQRADLLLLDEPTAGLDAESRDLVAAAIRSEARRGAAVVYVTHDEDALAGADRVLHMHAGPMHPLAPAPECATA